MNIVLWILQVVLGLYFVGVGVTHLVLPPNLPAPMIWMYELPAGLHYFSGAGEILAGLGLILPGITGLPVRLTPLAGIGLVLLMIGAAVWHAQRGEVGNIAQNAVLAVVVGFLAVARWRLHPLAGHGDAPKAG